MALKGLLLLMVLDYISGFVKGIYKKELSSEIGFKGLLRKVVILIVAALANVIQTFVGENVPIRESLLLLYNREPCQSL